MKTYFQPGISAIDEIQSIQIANGYYGISYTLIEK